jgi:hypothetical protein
MCLRLLHGLIVFVSAAVLLNPQPAGVRALAQEAPRANTANAADVETVPIEAPPEDRSELRRLARDSAVWVDTKNKRIIIDGEICLTRGQLEMFACPKETKEHESVVAIDGKAYVVHAGLLAIGAKIGGPVKFEPKYEPASGTRIDIYCFWTDKDGEKHSARAQDWVRNVKTKKPLEYHWVFAGSGFWTEELVDDKTGKIVPRKHYLGDAGDFICVSNFASATLDLPVLSPQDNENLLYEAFMENIPPRGTKVTVVLIPKLDAPAAGKRAAANTNPAPR